MKASVLLLLLMLMGVPAHAHGHGQGEIRYFAGLAGVISPMLEYIPRGEVDANKAATIDHYRIVYDHEGRLSNIKYFKNGAPSEEAYFYAHEVRYSYEDGRRVRQYFGVDGAPDAMWRHYYRSENVHREVYTRDGSVVTLQMFGVDGDRVSVGTGSSEFQADLSHQDGFLQTQTKNDGSPNVIFEYLPFENALITRDDRGFLYQILHVDPAHGNVTVHPQAGFAEMRILFDDYGNEMGWEFRDDKGKLVNRGADVVDPGYARWLYELDWTDRSLGHFRALGERYETADGDPFCIGGVKCRVSRSMDERGNLISQATFGPDGTLVVDPDSGYAKVEIDYDDQNRRTEVRYLGAEGTFRQTGVAVRRYAYDAAGSVTTEELDYSGKIIVASE